MDSLEKINDFLKSCLLPELKQDLDSIPIEREHFKDYQEFLKRQLPFLYDWIQQQPNIFLWTGEETEKTKKEIQANLIVLLCEISFPNSIYKLNQSELLSNAEKVLQNSGELCKEVHELIFKYYEEKLDKNQWKRQLGAVHGFLQYLEFRFMNILDHDQCMGQKFLMFCLSVSLNIRSCYETHYKNLSTSIFLIMLQRGANEDIITMNIHSVIYDAVFKDIHIMDSIPFIIKQWNCLLKCMDFYKSFDSFTWNYLDDMMEVLLRNISLAPDSATSICLLKFVNKLTVYFTINHKEYEEFFEKDLMQMKNLSECRALSSTNTSYTNYRWAKSILKMFIIESHKLLQTIEITQQILQEIHKIYILAILPIRTAIIEPHLVIFLDKFIAVLMETVKIHKYQADLTLAITLLLETFYLQLQNSDGSIRLQNFKQNIYSLLKTEAFQKYATI